MRDDIKLHMSTGEFAKLCGTTKDTLFHYDKIGLLKPEHVAENGYRSYSLNQYFLFVVILTLKEAGTPLAEIRSYLSDQKADSFLALLKENKKRLETDRRRIDHMISQMKNAIRATEDGLSARAAARGDRQTTEPRTEVCGEEWLVITPIPEEQDEKAFIVAGEEHVRYCTQRGLDDQLAIGCIKKKETVEAESDREDYYYSRLNRSSGAALAEPERIHIRPQGLYTVLEHCGYYDSIEESYRRLLDYIEKEGFAVSGCAYETDLLNFMGTASPGDYVVRIAIQVS